MTPYRIYQLLGVWTVVTIINASGEKGSESHEVNNEGTSETEDSAKVQAEKKKNTGAQKKFWIPTYPGSNPLNRKKIEITNSEINRFDSSIDESISGVIRNGTRAPRMKKNYPRRQEKDLSKLPFVWSGEDIAHNITVKDLASLDSSLVTEESERSREDNSMEFKKNYSPFTWSKSNRSDASSEKSSHHSESQSSSESSSEESVSRKIAQRDQRRVQTKKSKIQVTPKQDSQKVSSRVETTITKKQAMTKPKMDKKNKKTLKLDQDSYSSEKSETKTNDNILSREYYKKMVEAAVENTKIKLGYQKLSKTSQLHKKFKPIVPDSLMIDSKGSEPEIFKVNMDGKSFEKAKTEEEINFKTKHDQFATRSQLDTVKRRKKEKSEEKEERVKTLARDLGGKPKGENLKWNFTESKLDEIYKKQKAADFPSSCEYDAWSDVLLLNRTQRKSKQRKPKTGKLSNSYERSSGDMRAWPGRDIRDKAEELRKKEGKLTRKEKRKRAQKKVEKRQKEKKGVTKRKDGERYNDGYQDSTEAGKERTGKKLDLEYDYKGNDYSQDDSENKGKGGSRKQIDYDNSYDEKDFSDSSKQGKKKPVKEKGYGGKKDYDSDKPQRKFRMTTEGEKRHAYKEVKSYLNEMDEEYGGRPGGDTYRDRKRGGSYGRSGSRDRGRGWDRRGDERGKFSTGGRGRGGFDRGRDNWNDRRGGGWDDRKGGGWDDRRGGGWDDQRGGGLDDQRGGWDDQRGGGWDDRRGGGWDDRRGGGWGRDDREKGRDRRGRGRGDRRGGGGGRGGWGRGRGRGGRGGGRRRS